MTDLLRIPPHSQELETAIISAMLVDGDCVDTVVNVIKNDVVFYDRKHALVFKAIKSLYVNLTPVDLITVVQQLKEDGTIEQIGGLQFLINISNSVASSANVEFHCRILLEKYVCREAIRLATLMIHDAYDDQVDIFDLISKQTAGLDSITNLLDSGTHQMTMPEALDFVQKRVEMLSNKESDEITGVTSGLKRVDKFTSGWQPGTYITIGARPGMGKTSLLVGNMVAAAKAGVTTGFISIEMPTTELVSRAVAIDSHFHLSQLLTKGFEKQEYFQELYVVRDRMVKYKCHFNDSPSQDISNIINIARKWKRENGLGILFVDYLQLVSDKSVDSRGNREQEIASITRKFKALSKELKIPVIVPCQLSRAVETRGGAKRPLLSDLRESGAIEQDSDIVCFLYRPDYYGLEPEPDIAAENANSELIFSKFRQGGTGTVPIFWKGDKTKFYDHEYIENYSQDAIRLDKVADPSQAFDFNRDI